MRFLSITSLAALAVLATGRPVNVISSGDNGAEIATRSDHVGTGLEHRSLMARAGAQVNYQEKIPWPSPQSPIERHNDQFTLSLASTAAGYAFQAANKFTEIIQFSVADGDRTLFNVALKAGEQATTTIKQNDVIGGRVTLSALA